jgi:hypothetical protein
MQSADRDNTLADAWLQGLVPQVRCLRGPRNGPAKIERCGYTATLSLETLLWTRGARFPVWRLPNRLKCPRCGGMAVEVDWLPSDESMKRPTKRFYQCEKAVGRGTD